MFDMARFSFLGFLLQPQRKGMAAAEYDNQRFEFTFEREDGITWTEELQRHVCRQRGCQVMVTLTHPYCIQHLAQRGLYLAPSQVPGAGLGLFTNRSFRKGAVLGRYGGLKLTKQQLDHFYGASTAPYGIASLDPHVFYDAALKRSYVSMANHQSCRRANCYFANKVTKKGKNYVVLQSNRRLEAEEECVVCYGHDYDWKEQRHRTTPIV